MTSLIAVFILLILVTGMSLFLGLILAEQFIIILDRSGDVLLKFVDKLRGIIFQTAMDFLTVWFSARNQVIDLDERESKLAHANDASSMATEIKRLKLDLDREYAIARLHNHRTKMLMPVSVPGESEAE